MLDDKYRIERLLAVGGMGAVYVGTHTKLHKKVAIKILNPELSSAPMIERFHREAITASQIGHEGIAQVTDLGTSYDGEPFLVMEYLEGEPLASRLRASGPLPIEEACELGCAILSPLGAAHHAGIVHRDLKPDNVFLVRQSRGEMVKLLDFGISRTLGRESEFRLTTTGLVLGTPFYMSPEQARGDSEITFAADLYAFGVMLYEMLIGAVPIQGENYNQLMYRVLGGEFVRPRERRPEIPPALEQLILRAMASTPTERFASAGELEHALLAFCRPAVREHTIEGISAVGMQLRMSSPLRPAQLGTGVGTDRTVVATPTHPVPATPTAVRRSSNAARIAMLLGALGALGLGGVLLWQSLPRTGTAEPTLAGPSAQLGGVDAASPGANAARSPADARTVAGATAADAAPTMITLRFAIDPASAAVAIDGTPIIGTELSVVKDGVTHHLTITAAGCVDHTEDIVYDESQRLAVRLERSARVDKPRKPHKPHTTDDRIDSESPYK